MSVPDKFGLKKRVNRETAGRRARTPRVKDIEDAEPYFMLDSKNYALFLLYRNDTDRDLPSRKAHDMYYITNKFDSGCVLYPRLGWL
jgi:hypothetical protein